MAFKVSIPESVTKEGGKLIFESEAAFQEFVKQALADNKLFYTGDPNAPMWSKNPADPMYPKD